MTRLQSGTQQLTPRFRRNASVIGNIQLRRHKPCAARELSGQRQDALAVDLVTREEDVDSSDACVGSGRAALCPVIMVQLRSKPRA